MLYAVSKRGAGRILARLARQVTVAAWALTTAIILGGESDDNSARAAGEHWAFKPINSPTLPSSDASQHPIDALISTELNKAGLHPAPPADRHTLIRRLYLDMLGLPPSAAALEQFLNSREPDVYLRLVEAVLSSPRYGERWAQHWLDIVRYADTHGFEVNTPRPHAWPYRDYVIRAFNEDKPYDDFVFEQIAGDSVGEDAATGFMVAAAVLLPGQIGQDDISKRLARQDELNEIIVGTGNTFLGLTVGCARCHDHKFDPILKKDYYAMQAFFAGVKYGDRQITSPDRQQRLRRVAQLTARMARIQQQLDEFEPVAFTGHSLLIDDEHPALVTRLQPASEHPSNPDGSERGYKQDGGSTKRLPNLSQGRFTLWQEPGATDLLTYNPGMEGSFQLWVSWGAQAQPGRARDARYILDLDGQLATQADQKEISRVDQTCFANGDTAANQPVWSGLLNVGTHEFRSESRLILRPGDAGNIITADVIVLQTAQGPPREQPRMRAPVNASKNVEKFPPITTSSVRFTVFETSKNDRYEPCLDELEIYSVEPSGSARNVALASAGAVPRSSGNIPPSDRHRLEHINDGRYGNGRSWISNVKGGGWVQIDLPQPTQINRIVWGRDRDGKYRDRLPVRFQIDVVNPEGEWHTVARSGDRAPWQSPNQRTAYLARNLGSQAAEQLQQFEQSLKKLASEKSSLESPKLVYGGIFQRPEMTYVLQRGDPEQKQDRIGPQVLAALGSVTLGLESSDQERRRALAQWIVSPDNPLTARVMANRIWQYHFGSGLVETPSDFGVNGARPSHPELLDWLAADLIRHNWSIKHLHRRILLSQTYQQSSRIDTKAQAKDANCRLLWRFPARRLEAETIRDGMLCVTGELNLKTGGPGFSLFKSRGGLNGFPPVEKFGLEEMRRMIYVHKVRMETAPIFGAFDCPDAGQPSPKRSQSTTAIQALNLFNSRFVQDRSQAFAQRIRQASENSIEDQVDTAFILALGRNPAEKEAKAARHTVATHGLHSLCRVLFNCNEFLILP